MASDKIVIVTDSDFEEKVMKNQLPVVVDFWAAWCGPCRMVAPILEELAREYDGKAVVAKLNVDENPQMPTQFGIEAIPTMIFFKGGKEMEKLVGVSPKKEIEAKFKALL
jgi:thioredoxin 1